MCQLNFDYFVIQTFCHISNRELLRAVWNRMLSFLLSKIDSPLTINVEKRLLIEKTLYLDWYYNYSISSQVVVHSVTEHCMAKNFFRAKCGISGLSRRQERSILFFHIRAQKRRNDVTYRQTVDTPSSQKMASSCAVSTSVSRCILRALKSWVVLAKHAHWITTEFCWVCLLDISTLNYLFWFSAKKCERMVVGATSDCETVADIVQLIKISVTISISNCHFKRGPIVNLTSQLKHRK